MARSVRRRGIEPRSIAWEAIILPLEDRRGCVLPNNFYMLYLGDALERWRAQLNVKADTKQQEAEPESAAAEQLDMADGMEEPTAEEYEFHQQGGTQAMAPATEDQAAAMPDLQAAAAEEMETVEEQEEDEPMPDILPQAADQVMRQRGKDQAGMDNEPLGAKDEQMALEQPPSAAGAEREAADASYVASLLQRQAQLKDDDEAEGGAHHMIPPMSASFAFLGSCFSCLQARMSVPGTCPPKTQTLSGRRWIGHCAKLRRAD